MQTRSAMPIPNAPPLPPSPITVATIGVAIFIISRRLAAMAWACKTGRCVVLAVQGEDCHKLPDHHNAFGEAWWIDHDVSAWKCVFSPKDA